MADTELGNALDLLDDLIARAKRAGADSADALRIDGKALSVQRRLGKIEELTRSDGGDLGLRVLVGRRQAIVSTADLRPESLDALAERAVAMANAVPEDRFAGLADPDQIARDIPALDIYDPTEFTAEQLLGWAETCEEAARAVPGVTNSEGASASQSHMMIALAASNGFRGAYRTSRFTVGASTIAGEGLNMVRGHDYTSKRFVEDLDDIATVGRTAGERTVERMSPRRPKTARVPVIFDRRVSRVMVSAIASAVNGAAVARGTSFLKDRMGEKIASDAFTIIDDPFRHRAPASHPFDGEGIAGGTLTVVEGGVLKSWLLDCRSARQLGLKTTGHAARGAGSAPSPASSNLYLAPGEISRADLIREIGTGLLVDELMGSGVNIVTGDFSQGVAGFWIENGEIAYPVNEITVAGRFQDMLMSIRPASDLEFRSGTDAPSLAVEGLTVAGA
ncbi:modulator protein [Tistrella bauzanensis]|uniref:Modulator protein n=1 Tax=Tistrella bauzanensis TaxID=657419 RepID=A0ABQ1J8J6_9PROT|nr:TldD/PmbA family protein [Tistrella bauzanensis]GGB60516.1 modulator protein [Tistrella bauzanensis]